MCYITARDILYTLFFPETTAKPPGKHLICHISDDHLLPKGRLRGP